MRHPREGKTFIQRSLPLLLSAEGARAAEAESRTWLIRCAHCGFAKSVWDWGGVRHGASGRSATRLPCVQCGNTGLHRVERGPGAPPPPVRSGGWVVRLVLLVVAGAVLLTATVLAIVFGTIGLLS